MKIPSRGRRSGTGSESLVGVDHTVVRASEVRGVTTWSPALPSVQEAVEPMRSLKVQGRQVLRGSSWRVGKPARWEDHCNWKLEKAFWVGRGVLVISTGVGTLWDALATQFIVALVRN